jgi:hypothetical protein
MRPDRESPEHRALIKDEQIDLEQSFENVEMHLSLMGFIEQRLGVLIEVDGLELRQLRRCHLAFCHTQPVSGLMRAWAKIV